MPQGGTRHPYRPGGIAWSGRSSPVGDTGPVANGGTGILTPGIGAMAPEAARRTWARWVGLGVLMIAVAVTAVLRDGGALVLLGADGLFLLVRGALLLC